MNTYTLSIEDRVGTGVNCKERAVMARTSGLKFEERYNPNAMSTKPFNSKNNEFDTPFSIVHPFREVAVSLAQRQVKTEDMKYDISVNDAQRRLFENILTQEVDALRVSGTTYRKVQEDEETTNKLGNAYVQKKIDEMRKDIFAQQQK